MSTPFTRVEMTAYLEIVLKRGSLVDEIAVVQRYLKYLHRPEFIQDWQNETRETIQQRIAKYSRIFRALLAIRDGYTIEQTVMMTTDIVPVSRIARPQLSPSKLNCMATERSVPSRSV